MRRKYNLTLLLAMLSLVLPAQHFTNSGNPLIKHVRTADPSAHVWDDGSLWIYTSGDPDSAVDYTTMDGYRALSTSDMVNFEDHGVILHSKDISWGVPGYMFAPTFAFKNNKYYCFYPHAYEPAYEKMHCGVAVSDVPEGPFKDIGIIEGVSGRWIDPCVFTDEDGASYLYWGVFEPKVARLKENMLELDESPRDIDYGAKNFFEGSYMHSKDGIYYFSYSTEGKGGHYSMGDNPYGPFEYKGAVNPSQIQDHHSMIEYKGQWYFFYHVPDWNGGSGFRRNTCVEYLYYNEDGTLKEVYPTKGLTGTLLPKPSAKKWEVVDIPFRTSESLTQPEDRMFSAELSCEGNTIQLAGFYNGDSSYILRFCPDQSGVWTYKTSSDIDDLNGLTGEIRVGDAEAGRKGGISLNPESPREFMYSNGEPYYPICFEVDWLFALDAGNGDDIPVTRKFVNTIAENGYNQVIMNVFAYDVGWDKDPGLKPEHDYGSPGVFPFAGTNDEPDHSKLNIEYFRRLDRVIDYLDQKGIAAHLMIYVWNKKVNWPEADSEADNRYFDYVVKRYQAYPNMVWDISKEALGYGHDDVNYISRRIDRLRKLDAHKRLITVHDYNYCKGHKDKLDFASVQLWKSELTRLMLSVRENFPDQPVLNIEHGGYEKSPYKVFHGNYVDPEVCLERAYQCVFAGTYPSHYWQGAAWYAIIPDMEALAPEDRPKLEYYKYMADLVSKYDIGGLIAGEEKGNGGFCLHNNDDLYIYYMPEANYSALCFLPYEKHKEKTMKMTWFNPYTGEYDEPTSQILKGIHTKVFKPGDEGFRVLIVEIDTKD